MKRKIGICTTNIPKHFNIFFGQLLPHQVMLKKLLMLSVQHQQAAIKSISTEAPTAKPVTPIQVRAGSLSFAKYDA